MKRVCLILLCLIVGVFNAEAAKTKHHGGTTRKHRSAATRSRSGHTTSASRYTTRFFAPTVSQGPFSTVVIDAGHGGHDRGGIPQNIIAEKGVALDVSLRLSRALQRSGFNTILTRSDDTFISLGQRVAIANAHPSAIFMCIHFNSGLRRGARGIETYYNAASAIPLANRIQRRLMTTTSGENRGVKHANYYVLRNNRLRAVLAECGFLTNPTDTALARSASYRQTLANQIAAAIVEYRNSL